MYIPLKIVYQVKSKSKLKNIFNEIFILVDWLSQTTRTRRDHHHKHNNNNNYLASEQSVAQNKRISLGVSEHNEQCKFQYNIIKQ